MFEWSVELPERSGAAFGQPRPRALLHISSADHGEESLRVPVAVARQLRARKQAGELSFASRNELLFEVRRTAAACAHARLEDLVGRRDYAVSEIAERLRSDGYPASVTEPLLARMQEAGALDDSRFAASFIRSKLASGWGARKIARELSRRGIELEDVSGWPEEFMDGVDEHERALELARRRRLTGKNDLQKIVRFLCARGFSTSVAFDVAREVLDEQGA